MPCPPSFGRRLVLGCGLLLALLLAPGCGPAEDDPGSSDPAGREGRAETLVIATIADPGGVNELTSGGTRAFDDIAFRMFAHLLEEQPDFAEHPPTFAPRLAERWEFSEDRLALTVHLREGLEWSDGHPLTAEDVRFTWQAQTDPDLAWPAAYFKANIRDVEVVDPTTVRFHFHEVTPTQILEINEGVILPKHAWGEVPFAEWRSRESFFQENLVTSGPYTLERWTPQQEVVLTANDRYYEEGLPKIRRVAFRMIPEKANQVTQLLAGDVHFVEQLPNPDIERIEASETARVDAYWHRLYTFVAWNLERPPFDDRRVRQAIALGADQQEIVDTLWGPWARVATTPIVSNVWAHNDAVEPWPHDPAAARRLLDEAGWVDSDGDGIRDKGGRALSFEVITNQGNQPRIDAVVMLQEQLRQVGIDARPRVLEFNTMMSQLDEGDYEGVLSGWGMPTTLDLRYAFHSDSIGADNFTGYSNPEVDRLIEEVEEILDPLDAKPQFDRLQELIHQDQPMLFLWESQRVNGVSNRLRNVRSNLLSSLWNLRAWELEPAP